MKHLSILAIFLICFPYKSIRAQSPSTNDSLVYIYENTDVAIEKFRSSQELVWAYYYTDIELAKKYFESEYEAIINSDYPLRKTIAYRQASQFAARDYKYERALNLIDTARQILIDNQSRITKKDYKEEMIQSFFWEGNYYYRASEIAKSNESLILALELLEGSKDTSNYIKVLTSMGINYFTIANYKKAAEKLKGALHLSVPFKDLRSTNMIQQYLGYSYSEQSLYDSAKYHLVNSVEMAVLRGDLSLIKESNLGIAEIFEFQGIPDSTISTIERSMVVTENLSYPLATSQEYLLLARAYTEKKNYKKGRTYLDEFEALREMLASPYLDQKYLRYRANLEYQEGNFKLAFNLLEEGATLRDSLNSLEYKKNVESIESQYQSAKKDVALANNEILINKQMSQRKLLVAGGLASLLLACFFWYRKNVSVQLFRQQKRLDQERISQLEKEKKILSMNAMIEGQEAERIRIAKDLHDGLGGLLSTVKAHFSNIQSEIRKIEKIDVYNKANNLVDEACDEVRRISHNLMPGALRLQGLCPAVEALSEQMENAHDFDVVVEVLNFETRMDESKELFIYRIIQEALNNIIKHANAKQVLIQLSETAEEYHFIIEDDGVGFLKDEVIFGLGIKSIQSRIDFLKGTLDVDSQIGVGTTLSFHIPKNGIIL